ncbi:hypothetical protein BZB76_5680 [Actinomadura pelletieri DSM 43383]|uniref:Uncharacterized protein n=1 Tax=Actinomadura pelletieri DSM 43383 TaxID=1120940 RepID=A0A495QHD9_9ACTN|nr:hypothetical protein BZB76_5680 [Actinomadura pelletieri DSM 43383]
MAVSQSIVRLCALSPALVAATRPAGGGGLLIAASGVSFDHCRHARIAPAQRERLSGLTLFRRALAFLARLWTGTASRPVWPAVPTAPLRLVPVGGRTPVRSYGSSRRSDRAQACGGQPCRPPRWSVGRRQRTVLVLESQTPWSRAWDGRRQAPGAGGRRGRPCQDRHVGHRWADRDGNRDDDRHADPRAVPLQYRPGASSRRPLRSSPQQAARPVLSPAAHQVTPRRQRKQGQALTARQARPRSAPRCAPRAGRPPKRPPTRDLWTGGP